ncbi:hypothetical protein M0G43_09680 [Subsaxibacter sp. CAU 1640]|uniref:hypothetical protein n=1 Tax=Subsaxibacter sp. CAU 1640 TaxID=2933271 RepID=UPI00200350E8|nr:hypothetical protein [Subsaxibacter sp. CAU 1640]MCK7590843.1 hypothetical protein [Subsaxibacter sp. CAU 1640]
MKQVYTGLPNGVLALIFIMIFTINGIAAYYGNSLVPNITRITSILILLTLYYIYRNRMANVFLTIFLFSFLGDLFYVFNLGELSSKLSTTFYLGSYSLLVFVLLGKFKRIKYEGLVSIYLIVVFLLNSYFLYVLYGVIKENFADNINMVLSVCHGIILLAMTFFAFAVYLSQETTQSIIFLVMVFCFVFSDVLTYICNMYVFFWVFEFVSNMLHLASLILLFTYVYNHHKIIKVKPKMSVEDYLIKGSERLTA